MLQKIKKLLFYLSMAPLRVAAYEVSDWNGEGKALRSAQQQRERILTDKTKQKEASWSGPSWAG